MAYAGGYGDGYGDEPVPRWNLDNGITSVDFTINPKGADYPGRQATIIEEQTVSDDGQAIIFMGRDKLPVFEVEGRVITQTFYETLNTWSAESNVLRLTDDHGDQWDVLIENWNWTRLNRRKDWAFDYKARFKVLSTV